ncbi:hypothetical protein W97_01637 [Coniosporium apollinis CBS 100218]|uniref:Uncharacterized protein n=1 Tax=Coniosporium apollinis (strain CBS 100218) TaxID=1168221 RepID=R7YKI0_CONA1|nr:uncharacterized protein W97_01637 [Coniosporium apollinis CBS 100218]EON62415.1 hypothetical protein W97_01637 [Coniosporium apollinis CBS 100218]
MSLPCINSGSAATDRPPGARNDIVSPADLAAHSEAQKPRAVDERIEAGVKGVTDKKGVPKAMGGAGDRKGLEKVGLKDD